MQELGKQARDRVTGFEGIITARIQHLTGCDRYLLTPPVDKEGNFREPIWLDEGLLEITGNGICPVEDHVDISCAYKI